MTYKGYTLRPCVLARGVSRFELADTQEMAKHIVDVKADKHKEQD